MTATLSVANAAFSGVSMACQLNSFNSSSRAASTPLNPTTACQTLVLMPGHHAAIRSR